ncbi:glycosyltransferase family 8 protein [Paraphaeosphaeria sporulosa]|uniref:Glycosyltransferase family 8 protein n=1 Tax=Paraphaeosphaeria sporulosa TaxID=1460663 RepID=A0A177BW61_9PLEO|nr:glycosyltransferase family 8 protein [Paraphaeosphaeria sporulosa]OAF99190.1 glycosyltransferase family 8 protein [Paraphaeosphaeria sporulosa]
MIFKFRLFFVVASAALLGITWCIHIRIQAAAHATPRGSTYRGFNSTAHLPSTNYAIVTFLTGQASDESYFTATRVLTHQLLHAESTKVNQNNTSFLVLCSETVPAEQKTTLRGDGATVVEIRDVPVNWWIRSAETRWKEQFSKLRVFEMEEYSRILYLDADTVLTGPVDGIFAEPEVVSLTSTLDRKDQVRWGEAKLPSEWLFAARSDAALTGERTHPTPPLQSKSFNAGFFLIKPDRQVFAHILSVMALVGRFDTHTMEQGLLNYVFRREGRMPWRELHWRWSATWPTERDLEEGVVTLHDRLWKTGPQPLRDLWNAKKGEMMNYHEKRKMAAA